MRRCVSKGDSRVSMAEERVHQDGERTTLVQFLVNVKGIQVAWVAWKRSLS